MKLRRLEMEERKLTSVAAGPFTLDSVSNNTAVRSTSSAAFDASKNPSFGALVQRVRSG